MDCSSSTENTLNTLNNNNNLMLVKKKSSELNYRNEVNCDNLLTDSNQNLQSNRISSNSTSIAEKQLRYDKNLQLFNKLCQETYGKTKRNYTKNLKKILPKVVKPYKKPKISNKQGIKTKTNTRVRKNIIEINNEIVQINCVSLSCSSEDEFDDYINDYYNEIQKIISSNSISSRFDSISANGEVELDRSSSKKCKRASRSMLKNSLQPNSLESYLANINRKFPRLSSRDKVRSWEYSYQVYDVEDVVNFEEKLQMLTLFYRDNKSKTKPVINPVWIKYPKPQVTPRRQPLPQTKIPTPPSTPSTPTHSTSYHSDFRLQLTPSTLSLEQVPYPIVFSPNPSVHSDSYRLPSPSSSVQSLLLPELSSPASQKSTSKDIFNASNALITFLSTSTISSSENLLSMERSTVFSDENTNSIQEETTSNTDTSLNNIERQSVIMCNDTKTCGTYRAYSNSPAMWLPSNFKRTCTIVRDDKNNNVRSEDIMNGSVVEIDITTDDDSSSSSFESKVCKTPNVLRKYLPANGKKFDSDQKEEFYTYLGIGTRCPENETENIKTLSTANVKRRSLRVRQLQMQQKVPKNYMNNNKKNRRVLRKVNFESLNSANLRETEDGEYTISYNNNRFEQQFGERLNEIPPKIKILYTVNSVNASLESVGNNNDNEQNNGNSSGDVKSTKTTKRPYKKRKITAKRIKKKNQVTKPKIIEKKPSYAFRNVRSYSSDYFNHDENSVNVTFENLSAMPGTSRSADRYLESEIPAYKSLVDEGKGNASDISKIFLEDTEETDVEIELSNDPLKILTNSSTKTINTSGTPVNDSGPKSIIITLNTYYNSINKGDKLKELTRINTSLVDSNTLITNYHMNFVGTRRNLENAESEYIEIEDENTANNGNADKYSETMTLEHIELEPEPDLNLEPENEELVDEELVDEELEVEELEDEELEDEELEVEELEVEELSVEELEVEELEVEELDVEELDVEELDVEELDVEELEVEELEIEDEENLKLDNQELEHQKVENQQLEAIELQNKMNGKKPQTKGIYKKKTKIAEDKKNENDSDAVAVAGASTSSQSGGRDQKIGTIANKLQVHEGGLSVSPSCSLHSSKVVEVLKKTTKDGNTVPKRVRRTSEKSVNLYDPAKKAKMINTDICIGDGCDRDRSATDGVYAVHVASEPGVSNQYGTAGGSSLKNSNRTPLKKARIITKIPSNILNVSEKVKEITNSFLLLPNPLKFEKGDVLHAYFECEFLIVIQEFVISFWKYSKVIQMLGKSQEWALLGECKRKVVDEEVTSPYKNRICISDSDPIYIELRSRQLPNESRKCNLASLYVNIYYYNTCKDRILQHSVQLDTIKCTTHLISYTTILHSRYFILCWKQQTILGNHRTGLCKYALTPDLETLASIREFKNLRHIVYSLECCGDEHLVGFGESQITIWNHQTGDILTNLEMGIMMGENVGSIIKYIEAEKFIFIYQFFNNDDTDELPQLKIYAITLSLQTPSFRCIYSHELPLNFVAIKSSIHLNDYLIITAITGEEVLLMPHQPHRLLYIKEDDETSSKRFYSTGSYNFIEITGDYLNVKNIHENLLT